jgi:uncharacterized YigZ family protein
MPVFSYRSIQMPAQGSFKEKGSRFLAFAYPVDSEVAVRTHLDALRREYFDARHHCYAWMLGPEKKNFRAADDGEPSHSAGDPILGQIRSRELTNVLIVVVRYFGGVKLGVGGLIAAYREAAADALRNAAIIEEEVMISITLSYPYDKTPEAMRLVKEHGLTISEQTYGDRCVLSARVALRNREALHARIRLLNIPLAAIEITG